ncbi:MAG: type I-C CRISPR-associated protein Cas8c/Csd1 [Firmicutes bacterium]|nr:type I-C CRISPR-associated protein Cas8c/Csd1 [Bacillota bacterium]
MILQALVEYYEALAEKGEVVRPGYSLAKISFALSIGEDGSLLDVIDLREEAEQGKGKKKALFPRQMQVPEQKKRSSGIAPNLLCDNSTYFLGIDAKGKPDRSQKCFEAAKDLHIRTFGSSETAAARAICAFFRNWDPATAEQHPALQEYKDEILAGGNLIFRFRGGCLQDAPELRKLWLNKEKTDEEEIQMRCLVTGEYGPVAKLHPAFKGVRGAQSTGASLVSFNAPAFESYEREQGYNAPVSHYAAFAYGTALNYLLADYEHVKQLGDTTLVFWAKSGEKAYQDLFTMGLDSLDEDLEQNLHFAINALAKGKSVPWESVELQPDEHFYILGLSPNAGRISVRFFLRDSFGSFMRNIQSHEERLEIDKYKEERDKLSPWWILQETVNPKAKDKKPLPQLAGDYLRSILLGKPYPNTLYINILLRIQAERKINYRKAAVIKAFLIKNYREEISVKLDRECRHIAYVLGRLFSVLEEIQEAANPGINTTIQDKYFTSAGSTPSRIFPTLLDLANKHLRKLKGETGKHIYLEKRLSEIMNLLEEDFPDLLSLKDKGIFQIGYYHQKQARYSKKEDK